MATGRSAFEKFLLGNKDTAQNEVDAQQAKQSELIDALSGKLPEYQAYIGEATNFGEGKLADRFAQQNLLNNRGLAYSAQDKQAGFIDQAYLNSMKNSMREREDMSLAQGRQALQQQQLKGRGGTAGEVMGALDTIQRSNRQEQQLAVKQEKELAYQKAAQDIANKKSVADSLNTDERASAMNYLQTRLELDAMEKGYSDAEYNMALNNLSQASDGFLIKLLQTTMTVLGTAAAGALGVPPVASVPIAKSISTALTDSVTGGKQ